jgi:hypothetical protein
MLPPSRIMALSPGPSVRSMSPKQVRWEFRDLALFPKIIPWVTAERVGQCPSNFIKTLRGGHTSKINIPGTPPTPSRWDILCSQSTTGLELSEITFQVPSECLLYDKDKEATRQTWSWLSGEDRLEARSFRQWCFLYVPPSDSIRRWDFWEVIRWAH